MFIIRKPISAMAEARLFLLHASNASYFQSNGEQYNFTGFRFFYRATTIESSHVLIFFTSFQTILTVQQEQGTTPPQYEVQYVQRGGNNYI